MRLLHKHLVVGLLISLLVQYSPHCKYYVSTKQTFRLFLNLLYLFCLPSLLSYTRYITSELVTKGPCTCSKTCLTSTSLIVIQNVKMNPLCNSYNSLWMNIYCIFTFDLPGLPYSHLSITKDRICCAVSGWGLLKWTTYKPP